MRLTMIGMFCVAKMKEQATNTRHKRRVSSICASGLISFLLTVGIRSTDTAEAEVSTTATNVDMVLGRTAYITEAVDNLRGTGALKLDGKEWSARSVDGAAIEKDEQVRVLRIEGVKLIVERRQEDKVGYGSAD